jgi:phosphocarrier protein
VPERKVTIASSQGLHARPAKLFVEAAGRQPAKVRIAVAGKASVPANSMLSVLALGAKQGTEVTLSAEEGPGAAESLDALATLLATDLDAEPGEPAKTA